jgi:hypothetical protein
MLCRVLADFSPTATQFILTLLSDTTPAGNIHNVQYITAWPVYMYTDRRAIRPHKYVNLSILIKVQGQGFFLKGQ